MAEARARRASACEIAKVFGNLSKQNSQEMSQVPFKCLPDCGECCIVVPIPKQVFAKHRHRCQVELLEVRDIGSEAVPDTKDHLCAFLDRETKQCTIYDDRPEMCRLYGTKESPDLGCSYVNPFGKPRSRAERRRIQRETVKGMETLLSAQRTRK